MTDVLATLETYYDTAPRASATATGVGPFTLFVRDDPAGWHFYARPRLGLDRPVTVADVDLVRARQRALGVPESLEWVRETTPSLLAAARGSGMTVEECPLLVLSAPYLPWGLPGGPLDGAIAATDGFRQMVLRSSEALQRRCSGQ